MKNYKAVVGVLLALVVVGAIAICAMRKETNVTLYRTPHKETISVKAEVKAEDPEYIWKLKVLKAKCDDYAVMHDGETDQEAEDRFTRNAEACIEYQSLVPPRGEPDYGI
jgi:hypothetical protein